MTVGSKYGKLTVLSRAENDRFGRTRWNVVCDCGTKKVIALYQMNSGHTKSCGCIRGRSNFRHGGRGTPTHNTWVGMKQRCLYPKHDEYARYGGRGIQVCERWMTYENFLADMGEKPEGMTIERENSDGNYEPANCRWATMKEQNRNRSSNINVEIDGRTQCVKDWCDELGIHPDRIYARIRRGSTPKEAIVCSK
jgi:hypothetical protein